MKLFAAFALAMLSATPTLAQDTPASVITGTQQFDMKVLTTGLQGPWEITWGPDDYLWVTERTGGRIDRINPADGGKTVSDTSG